MDKNASREFCFQYDLPMGNNYKCWIKKKINYMKWTMADRLGGEV